MKIQTTNWTIEADTLDDMKSLLALLPATAPRSAPSGSLAIPGGNREAELRETYRSTYKKGFSMKGKTGNALEHLAAIEAAGWPEAGGADGEPLDGPPASQADDGKPIF